MRFGTPRRFSAGLHRHIPLAIAIAVGLAFALASARYMLAYMNTHIETVQVPVSARDIPPYTVISSSDIAWRETIKGGEEPGMVRDPSEAVGKLALTTLYTNEQIRKERLADPNLVEGKQIVSINVDVARSVGGSLRAGDLVDVWWVTDPALPNWTLAAANAVVMDIRDSAGRSVIPSGGGIVQQALGAAAPVQSSPPAVAVLAVRTEDVPKVVGGASPKSQNVVLAKKYSFSLPVEEPVPPEKNQAVKTPPKINVSQNQQGR